MKSFFWPLALEAVTQQEVTESFFLLRPPWQVTRIGLRWNRIFTHFFQRPTTNFEADNFPFFLRVIIDSMQIHINGHATIIESGISIATLLREKGLSSAPVVVEQNRTILQPEEYERVLLAENDQVEIIRFVGGG